jgi:two-component system OmpR family response regulator
LRFLIIESDLVLNQMIQKAFNNNGYKTDEAMNMADAKYYINIRNYEIIILDYSFGEKEIINFIKEIRTNFPLTKVIIISEKDDVQTEINMLRNGADCYIRKPIHFDLLIARVEAKIRFSNFKQINIKDLTISPNEEKVIFKSKIIELKGKPFEVFTHLAKHPNQIISKEQLLDAIWEEPELVTPNVIEVAINQIRQKIDKPLGITTIETVRRRGYKFSYS